MIGLREFGEILAVIKESQMYSLAQFEQLCKDTQEELIEEGICAGAGEFFVRYYNLDWNWTKVKNFSMFVKDGRYKGALRIYGV